MKIAFVSHNYPLIIDGVGDHTFFLAKALRLQGHEVHVICPAKSAIIEQQHPFTYPIVQQWNIKGYRITLKKLRELQPDWIIIPYVPYAFNKWGMPVELLWLIYNLRKNGLKSCINFHEVKIRYNWDSKKSYPIGIVQRIIAYGICRFADRFVTSIEFYRDYLLKYTTKPIALIPIPPNYDTDIVVNKDAVKEVRNTIAPKGEKIIATYGIRDLPTIDTIFTMLQHEIPGCILLFCGRLNNPNAFNHLRHKVYITGYLSQEQVCTYLKAADVFYIPDPVDAKGRGGSCNKSGSLAAALVAGLPVVGTRGDLNNQLLKESEQVMLVEIQDISATIHAIVESLNSRKDKFENTDWYYRLNWNTIAQEFIKFLKN